jgi:hypothetical protein
VLARRAWRVHDRSEAGASASMTDSPRASNRDPLDLLCARVRTILTGVFNAFSKVQPLLSRLKTM